LVEVFFQVVGGAFGMVENKVFIKLKIVFSEQFPRFFPVQGWRGFFYSFKNL